MQEKKSKFSKNDLIKIVQDIMSTDKTDEEISDLIYLLEYSVPHPCPSDLIFYDERELTAKEIVEEALSYSSNLFLN